VLTNISGPTGSRKPPNQDSSAGSGIQIGRVFDPEMRSMMTPACMAVWQKGQVCATGDIVLLGHGEGCCHLTAPHKLQPEVYSRKRTRLRLVAARLRQPMAEGVSASCGRQHPSGQLHSPAFAPSHTHDLGSMVQPVPGV
jgi:hypothetical protein